MSRFVLAVVVLAPVLTGCGGGGGSGTAVDLASGDPTAGKQVFATQGCGHCHTFVAAGSNRNVGPNLDEVARRYSAEFILDSITDPSAYIEKGSGGTIGGTDEYNTTMPPFGPDAPSAENVLTEQQLADIVAFIKPGGKS